MASLARQFDQLCAPARRVALTGIVDCLTAAEWRDLALALRARDFRCDIVARLPVELVAAIFRHLPVHAVFLYARVSRRWRDLLSSEHVRHCCLAQWYSDRDPKLHCESADILDPALLDALKAEHVKRFEEGRPYSARCYHAPWRGSFNPLFNFSLDNYMEFEFCRETIAWIERAHHSRSVKMYNLRTAAITTLAGVARETITRLKLTDRLLALFTASGICYVYDLDTKLKTYFRCHNASIEEITGSGRTIAIRMRDTDTAGVVYTWNALERSTRCWRPQPERRNQCMIVDEQARSVVILAASDNFTSGRFTAKRYTLDGTFLSEHVSDVHVSADEQFLDSVVAEPMDYDGRLYHLRDRNLAGTNRWNTGNEYDRTMCSVVFDNRLNDFVVSAEPFMRLEGLPARSFMWKTAVYFTSNRGPATYETWRKKGVDTVQEIHSEQGLTVVPGMGYEVLRGNEHFVVQFREASLYVWCFDRGLELPESTTSG